MSEPDQPAPDEPAPLPSNAAEQGAPPAADDDVAAAATAPRFVLPSIDLVRIARLVRAGLRAAIVVVVVSVGLGATAAVAAGFYSQFGAVRNEPNARAWGELVPRFAGQAVCTSCHAPEAVVQDASAHVAVSCEDCHGPAAAHSSSTVEARATTLVTPTSAICVTCHGGTSGRPSTFPAVDPAKHYAGGPCLRCHGPHAITAVRPPTVSHPLANLPECTTCHAPDGLKTIPAGHELVGDAVCLSCHGLTANGKG